ncbi:Cyclase family protein [Sulfidibacter corallicola]|uniref:Kynurenine formamidase n=1 Tax=Sulfidibacter corallicola TaxID=2818388 RepID=A0A8A4TD65_SULCO|nr:cyclase family protein [Sulfidibacter corallicola]QTD47876.1 cyclase family protein [Sulfidibacter corallicola]
MTLIDITPAISASTAVFPGDVPYRRSIAMDFQKGDHLLLSSIQTTLHVGAHADAPNHYHRDGIGIDRRDPKRYVGACQVIGVSLGPDERIYPYHVTDQDIEITEKRVLFRTDSFPDPDNWNSDFNSLSPELVIWLAERGVVLVGIDTPSIDPETSQALESHQMVYQKDLAVLEGIVLGEVAPGRYILLAQPLKLRDADAGPVRALLLPFDTDLTRM